MRKLYNSKPLSKILTYEDVNSEPINVPEIIKYHREEKRLKDLLDEEVWEMLAQSGAIIAGGAITSLFSGKDVNDLDVYFKDMEGIISAVAACYGQEDYIQYEEYYEVGAFTMHCMGSTDKSILFNYQEQDVQFMHFKYFNSAEEIFDTFDFTCCMAAYDVSKGEFILHEDFLRHTSQRYLKYNPDTAFPLISALRVDKYKDKGYSISRSEMLRVSLSCTKLDIQDWEEAARQVGGMYGYCVDDIFDREKEFSIEELIDQLGGMESNMKGFDNKEVTIEKLIELIDCDFVDPEAEEGEYEFKEGYYYKEVNSRLESPIRTNSKITYEVGTTVEGSELRGIYCVENNKELNSRHCVELKPLSDKQETKRSHYGRTGQVQLFGPVKVTNVFSHYKGLLSPLMEKWRYHV